MHAEELEPPSYEDCTCIGTPVLTIDLKDTKIYSPATHLKRIHYCITSSLNRDFVKGGFGLVRINPYKPSERIEVHDIRAVGGASFRLSGWDGGVRTVATCQRKFGFSGHSWEVRQLNPRNMEERRVLTAKKTSKEDGTLRWCDGTGRLLGTDTRLVRRRGNHENQFQMPVLSIVAEIEQDLLDLLVASWLARVWVEVVHAKRKTLMDGAHM